VALVNSAPPRREGGIKQLVRVLKELELEFAAPRRNFPLMTRKSRTLVGSYKHQPAQGRSNAAAIQESSRREAPTRTAGQSSQAHASGSSPAVKQALISPDNRPKPWHVLPHGNRNRDTLRRGQFRQGTFPAAPELDLTSYFIGRYYNACNP